MSATLTAANRRALGAVEAGQVWLYLGFRSRSPKWLAPEGISPGNYYTLRQKGLITFTPAHAGRASKATLTDAGRAALQDKKP